MFKYVVDVLLVVVGVIGVIVVVLVVILILLFVILIVVFFGYGIVWVGVLVCNGKGLFKIDCFLLFSFKS